MTHGSHACGIRAEGSRDAIMVYGTTTQFNPDFEGRIADSVERAPLPPDWQAYLDAAPDARRGD